MNTVFVDTGYLLALELANDQHHQAALTHGEEAKGSLPMLMTTSYVLNEVVSYFSNRGHHARAISVGNMLLHSPSVQLIHVDEVLFYGGWAYFRKHQDKTYSLTDCISFVVMGELGITTAYAFDRHFEQAGFLREP